MRQISRYMALTQRRVLPCLYLLTGVWILSWLRPIAIGGSGVVLTGVVDALLVVAWGALGVAIANERAFGGEAGFWRGLPVEPGTELAGKLATMAWTGGVGLLIQRGLLTRPGVMSADVDGALLLSAVDLAALMLVSGAIAALFDELRVVVASWCVVVYLLPVLVVVGAGWLGLPAEGIGGLIPPAVAATLALAVLAASIVARERSGVRRFAGLAVIGYPVVALAGLAGAQAWTDPVDEPSVVRGVTLEILALDDVGGYAGFTTESGQQLFGVALPGGLAPGMALEVFRVESTFTPVSGQRRSEVLEVGRVRIAPPPASRSIAIPLMPAEGFESRADVRGTLQGVVHAHAVRSGRTGSFDLQQGEAVPAPRGLARIWSVERIGGELVVVIVTETLAIQAAPVRTLDYALRRSAGDPVAPTRVSTFSHVRMGATPTAILEDAFLEMRFPLEGLQPERLEVTVRESLGTARIPFRVEDFRAEDYLFPGSTP